MGLANYSVPHSALMRVASEGPTYARCSDNKTAALVKPFATAVRYPYIQVNRKNMVSWLIFDLDHENSWLWEDAGLPPPNLIVRNPSSGTSHLFYAIVPVSTSENSRSKPIQYMRALYSAMAERLRADPSYCGPVAKTPGHPWWQTTELHNREYSLAELHDFVELGNSHRFPRKPRTESAHSRHCILFDSVRFFAYGIVREEKERGGFPSFLRKLENFADAHNHFRRLGFSSDLSVAQVRATVKSVARWTWDRYTGNAKARGSMVFANTELTLCDRQSQSANRTHRLKVEKSVNSIVVALQTLQSDTTPTITAIATQARLSRQTVSRHLSAALQILNGDRKYTRETSSAPDVNFGAHQIYGGSLPPLGLPNKQSAVIREKVACLADSKQRLGAVGARKLFGDICGALVPLKNTGLRCGSCSFEGRGRLARIIVGARFSSVDSLLVALSVQAAGFDSRTWSWTDDMWMAYGVKCVENFKRVKLQRFTPLLDSFRKISNGSEMALSEHECSLWFDFVGMAAREFLDPLSFADLVEQGLSCR